MLTKVHWRGQCLTAAGQVPTRLQVGQSGDTGRLYVLILRSLPLLIIFSMKLVHPVK